MVKSTGVTPAGGRPWLLVLVLGVAIAGVVYLLILPQPVMVDTVLVEPRELLISVNEQGRTRARLPYTVAAPVGGQLLRTALVEGDIVSPGQVMTSIAVAPEDQRTQAVLAAALTAAQANAAAAESSLREAQGAAARALQESQRREQLFAQRMIAQEERDMFRQTEEAARAREAVAQATVQASRAEVQRIRAQLMGVAGMEATGVLEVVAPVQGTVQRVFERSERIVPAGTPLFQISDGDAMELVIDLLTQEAVRVRPGDRIVVTGWGGEQALEGIVRYVEPEAFTKYSALGVEEQRVNVIGELRDGNPGLGAEYRIEAAIIVDELPAVLAVPVSALFRRAEDWHVFVVDKDRARLQMIQLGQRNSAYAEVLSGLQSGDVVVVFPSDLVTEGVLVGAL
jgi:HlyD family secretion protein